MQPLWLILLVHLATFFMACMVCHGELVRSRPAARHLTEFYLMMSIGGVLGGMFNAVLAPMAGLDAELLATLQDDILRPTVIEQALAIALEELSPKRQSHGRHRRSD